MSKIKVVPASKEMLAKQYYLRLQGQTGRESCAFDRVVRDELKEVLDGLVCPDEQDDAN